MHQQLLRHGNPDLADMRGVTVHEAKTNHEVRPATAGRVIEAIFYSYHIDLVFDTSLSVQVYM